MKVQWLLTGLLIVLAGCNSASNPSSSETPVSSSNPVASEPIEESPSAGPTSSQPTEVSPTTSPKSVQPVEASPTSGAVPSAKLSPPASNAYRISQEGIGSAKVGMTVGELKKSLAGKAQFQVKSPFIVDFDAIAVVQDGKEQYYILYPAGMPLADSDVIEALVTDNPNYRTAQGVGPGTAIAQAQTVYGQATLSHNTMNESREYVKFANQPSDDIAFRTKAPAGEPIVGIYPSSDSEFKETQNFEKTAAIGFVEVYCRQNCPLPSPY